MDAVDDGPPRKRDHGVETKDVSVAHATQWAPVLIGSPDARLVWQALRYIRDDMLAREESFDDLDPSLIRGLAGVALFLGYYAATTSDDVAADLCVRLIKRAVEKTWAEPSSLGLFFGVTGVAWVADHLQRHLGVVDDNLIDPTFDGELEAAVGTHDPQDNFDLFSGVVGLGVYGLERERSGEYGAFSRAIIKALVEASEVDSDGRFWRTSLSVAAVPGVESGRYVNLGIPHGQAGVVAFLARVHSRLGSAGKAPTARLLSDAVDWFLAREAVASVGARFGMSYLTSPGSRRVPHAWCYGDLAVATALAAVPKTPVGTMPGERLSSLIRHCTRSGGVAPIDAALCHGAAGTAHMFARLSNVLEDEALAHASAEWYRRVLAMRSRGGIGGFWAYRQKTWHREVGFLRGAAGIGLALLSGVSTLTPAWDRLLLMPAVAS